MTVIAAGSVIKLPVNEPTISNEKKSVGTCGVLKIFLMTELKKAIPFSAIHKMGFVEATTIITKTKSGSVKFNDL